MKYSKVVLLVCNWTFFACLSLAAVLGEGDQAIISLHNGRSTTTTNISATNDMDGVDEEDPYRDLVQYAIDTAFKQAQGQHLKLTPPNIYDKVRVPVVGRVRVKLSNIQVTGVELTRKCTVRSVNSGRSSADGEETKHGFRVECDFGVKVKGKWSWNTSLTGSSGGFEARGSVWLGFDLVLYVNEVTGGLRVAVEHVASKITSFGIDVNRNSLKWLYNLLVKQFKTELRHRCEKGVSTAIKGPLVRAVNKYLAGQQESIDWDGELE